MDITIDAQIETPNFPNYLRVKGAESTIDIGSLDDKAYKQFEAQYFELFRQHYAKRRHMFINSK